MRLAPHDGATHHNLGLVLLRMGRHPRAIEAFRESLHHRPDSPATYLHLGHALDANGQRLDAIAAWREALRLDPANPAAKEALTQAEGENR